MIRHHVILRDMRPQSLSFPTKVAPDVLPSRADQDSFPAEGILVKKHFSGLPRPRSSRAGPIISTAVPRAAKTQAHEPQGSLDPQSSLNWADLGRIPTNRKPGFPLNYLVIKTSNLTAIPTKGPNYPWAILSESPEGSGATPDR